MKRDGVLEVHIVCANRPGLLVDVMAAVESRGLTIAHAKIACHSDIVFEYLSLEVRPVNSMCPESSLFHHPRVSGSTTLRIPNVIECMLKWQNEESVTQEVDEAAEIDSVKALIVNAICGSADLQ